MKKLLSIITLFTLFAWTAFAQRGFDAFNEVRYGILCQPGIQLTNVSTSTVYSNSVYDTRGCQGIATVLFSCTNLFGTTPKTYAFIEGSNDQTNWWGLTNCALATSTSLVFTNARWANTNVQAINTFLAPGTFTTATPSSDGYYGSYFLPASFTSASTLVTNVAGGTALLAFPVQSAPRYIHCVITQTGTAGSGNATCIFIAPKQMLP